MGYLAYAGLAEYEFEDRALAHLKVAIGLKLRRQESFFISWSVPADEGSGRFSIWVSPSTPLVFRFAGSRAPELNRVWIDALTSLSHTPRGLIMISESEAEFHATNQETDVNTQGNNVQLGD